MQGTCHTLSLAQRNSVWIGSFFFLIKWHVVSIFVILFCQNKWTTRRCFGFCRESISWQIPHRDQLQKAERRRIRNDWTKHAASPANASSNFRRNYFRTSLLPIWSNLSVFFIMQGEVGEVPANGRSCAHKHASVRFVGLRTKPLCVCLGTACV